MPSRIPKRITLPFGFVVRVREVSVAEMRELEEVDEDEADGLWIAEERTIYVLKSLPKRRKRYVLIHELVHAVLDAGHHALVEKVSKPT